MLPLSDLFPAGFLDHCRVRNRFTVETDPPHCLTVFFQNHLPRLNRFAENRTFADRAVAHCAAGKAHGEADRLIAQERMSGLTYVLAGRAQLHDRSSGVQQAVTAGMLLCFNQVAPNQIHLRPEPGFLEVGVVVDGRLGQRLRDDGLWPGPWTSAVVGDSIPLVKAFDELYGSLPDLERGYRSLCWRLLRICDLAQGLAEASSTDAGFATRARRILSEHPEPGFTVADAARLLAMPETRFRRRFTREIGISPGAWQKRQRMQRAADLLAELPVHRVAEELGYSDPALFSRQFRQAMGIPPSAVRLRSRVE